MSRYVLSFFSDSVGVITKILEADSKEEAIRTFFDLYIPDYTQDSEGFAWFKEDFYDEDRPLGSILLLN